jgi:hypothetical protein
MVAHLIAIHRDMHAAAARCDAGINVLLLRNLEKKVLALLEEFRGAAIFDISAVCEGVHSNALAATVYSPFNQFVHLHASQGANHTQSAGTLAAQIEGPAVYSLLGKLHVLQEIESALCAPGVIWSTQMTTQKGSLTPGMSGIRAHTRKRLHPEPAATLITQ